MKINADYLAITVIFILMGASIYYTGNSTAFTIVTFSMTTGLLFMYGGFHNWWLFRRIQNLPTSKIRGLAMGLVEIQGRVESALEAYLISPLTRKPCVWYEYHIEQIGPGRTTKMLKYSKRTAPFYLKDKTGRVLVNPKQAEILIKNSIETDSRNKLPKNVIDFCKKNNIEFKHGTRLEFVEGYIGLNDQLYILGTAADNPYKKEATSHRSTEDIMIQSKIASPFYISTNHEKAVLKRIKKNTIICFLLGMSLTLLGLGIILDTFNLL